MRAASLCCLVALVSCKAPTPTPLPEPAQPSPVAEAPPADAAPAPQAANTWSVSSMSGAATLTQTRGERCALQCEVSGARIWERAECLWERTDMAFVSGDCGTTFVLFEYPLRATPSENTTVALVLRGTEPPVKIRLGQVTHSESILQANGPRARWLTGVVMEPGDRPHFIADGTGIEMTTVGGNPRTVRFDRPEDFVEPAAAAAPAIPPSTASAPRVAVSSLYQYVDGEGSTQFVQGLDNVPARFRKSAVAVEADISTVEAVKLPARKPEPVARTDFTRISPNQLAPPTPVQKPPPTNNDGCTIYGLSGFACKAVMFEEMKRRSGRFPQ